jgi:L-seryl-tRNA(Ser) seleniumtransferase
MTAVTQGYSNLEYNVEEGKRGKRYDHIKGLLRDLTGAEDAVVVNNNAAAVLLSLSALASKREVVISRGELVEIGGSFRIPDVMVQSGALLREVGTTNKTHVRDYEDAINEDTALLLKVHQSNYRIIGFAEDVSIDELVRLGKNSGIPVMFDLGSGCFVDLAPYGIRGEPVVGDVVKRGVDIVTFSGDKLLGGPQAGIIVGRKEILDVIGRHPLARAVRIDKLTLSALETTLFHYTNIEKAKGDVPVLRLLLQDEVTIKRRAQRILRLIKKETDTVLGQIKRDVSQAGGGSLPAINLPTYVVSLRAQDLSTTDFEERLRKGKPPVISRVREDEILLDARTINDSEVNPLVKAIKMAINEFFT